MADRRNHYEAAFEAFLRDHRIAYVAIDETRRSLVANGSLKSPDFIVSTGANASWLVDVKGRRFPSGDASRTYWKNWSTRDDLRSLAAWQSHFGPTFLSDIGFCLSSGRQPVAPANKGSFQVSGRGLRLFSSAAGRLCTACTYALRKLGYGRFADHRFPQNGPTLEPNRRRNDLGAIGRTGLARAAR